MKTWALLTGGTVVIVLLIMFAPGGINDQIQENRVKCESLGGALVSFGDGHYGCFSKDAVITLN